MPVSHLSYSSKQRGFNLVEVMVAMLIFAVGMLGLAGLQLGGTRSTNNAQMRTIATIQAHDMAERMRSNRPGMTAGDYNNITTASAATPENCITKDCDALEMSTFDAFEWNSNNATLLPSGRGTVTTIAGVPGNFRITVMWDELSTGVTGEACSNDPTVDLKCYTLEFRP